MTRALIADDEPHLVRHLQTLLALVWPELDLLPPARNGIEAAERIAAEQPDIAFSTSRCRA
jgi:YesN/AraC family two-component response regulator